MKNEKKYYLGLDIGTDSVGYAVTDTEYRLLKFHGRMHGAVMYLVRLPFVMSVEIFALRDADWIEDNSACNFCRKSLQMRSQKLIHAFSCVYQRVIYGVKIQQTGIFSLMIRNIQTFNIWENIRQFIILFRI